MANKLTVPVFIQNFGQRILHTSRWTERPLVNNSVTLRMRLRDATDSDRSSFFSPQTGNWVSVNLPNLYSWNVVKPTVRGNKASMIQANVKVDIEPRFPKDSKAEMAAQVASAIYEQVNRTQWTLELEERLADETQIGAGAFIKTNWNPNIKTANKIEKWETVPQNIPGLASCPQCGVEIQVDEATPDEEGFASVPCTECGADAQVTQMPLSEEVDRMTGYEEHSFGDSETKVYPFWEFRCDAQGTEGGLLEHARWFEHHYLASLDELQLEYPASADVIQKTNTRWSYPLRWQYALRIGAEQPGEFSDETSVDQFREVRDIWLTPAKYLLFEASEDFTLKDENGKVRFQVKKGKNFKDATFEGKHFDEPPVLCFRLCGDSILDIYPSDFREEWTYYTFLANPSSFWGLFYTELISLQDIVNYMLTLQVYHIRRNAITSIIYNSQAFDPDDFEEDLIGTKEDVPWDIPINQMYGVVPALTLSREPMEMFQTIVQGKGDVTQVQPAMVGQAQPGETYHAQLLQRQQSLGLLAPAELSKAQGKVRWTKQQLRLKKKHWTDEDTETMLRLNSEWNQDFIAAFLDCDLDSDLIIDFVEGSEIPRSLMEREMALRAFLADLMTLAGVNPAVLTRETVNDILLRLSQSSNLDLDLDNTESELRLANANFDKLKMLVDQFPPTPPDLADQVVRTQIMARPEVILMLRPQPRQDYTVALEFNSDQVRIEAAKDEPNYVLIAAINVMSEWYDQSMLQDAQRQSQLQIAAQMPQIQMQQQMQQEQQGQERENQVQDEERKQLQANNDRQHQAQEADKQRDHERQGQLLSMIGDERNRQVQTATAGNGNGNRR